jgi:UDP-N-acetyl-D-mannosaminuronate dehydrogenase
MVEKGNRQGLKASRGDASNGQEFYVAFSPEREDPGNQTVARRDIPKVVGGLDARAALNRPKSLREIEKCLLRTKRFQPSRSAGI